MSETSPEEPLQRLELAVRAAELVPTIQEAEHSLTRAGMAGDVPLRLSLRKDGTLEVQAKAAHPLPEGLEIQRDSLKGLQVHAVNPAMARRLTSQGDVHRRLEALFDAVPQARIAEGSVLLELPTAANEEQLQGALRAALRAASALSEASHALTVAAERNRQRVRSTATPGELEGGRRFVKLLPSEDAKKPETTLEKETRIIEEARELLLEGDSHKEVLAHIQREIPNSLYSRLLLTRALQGDPRYRRQGLITMLLSMGSIALVFYVLYRLNLLGRLQGDWSIWIVAATAFFGSYGIWRGVGQFLDKRGSKREED